MTTHTHDRVVGLSDKKIVVGWLTDHVEVIRRTLYAGLAVCSLCRKECDFFWETVYVVLSENIPVVCRCVC
jgi:hypothetical protein